MKERIVNKAERHAQAYLDKKFLKAQEKLRKEKTGMGCGCSTCKRQAVNNANEYADMEFGGYENNPITHYIDEDGRIRTKANEDFKSSKEITDKKEDCDE